MDDEPPDTVGHPFASILASPDTPDIYGRALRDSYRGVQAEPLWRIDGSDRERHLEQGFYFTEISADAPWVSWVADWLTGPLIDVGCGTGDHALFYQDRVETVAIDVSPALVEVSRARGVRDARVADMFRLAESFRDDRFAGALVNGTQLGLGGSLHGVSAVLAELAAVTGSEARAVVDEYDPDAPAASELLGFRPDPTPGLAHRLFHFEYEDEVGPTLHFRLLTPGRLREACDGTGWRVVDVRYGDENCYYKARLEK